MGLSRAQIAGLMGGARARAYAERTGWTYGGDKVWTAEEIATLRRLYPDYRALETVLHDRTRRAIEHKAARLGIARRLRIWRPDEETRLRPPYVRGVPVSEILPLLNDKSAKQTWGKANHLKLKRPRRRPKSTGLPLIDEIRNRAFDLNISMRELDEIAGGKGLLRGPKRERWTAIGRAVRALDGELVVTFGSD